MTEGEFSAGDWIDRLARALPALAEAQKPYLPGYRDIRAFLPAIPGVDDGRSPAVRVGELGALYVMAQHSHLRGEEAHYAALDPIRHILLRHPTIARVVGPIIGRDNFYMQVLSSGPGHTGTSLHASELGLPYPLALPCRMIIAGLMPTRLKGSRRVCSLSCAVFCSP